MAFIVFLAGAGAAAFFSAFIAFMTLTAMTRKWACKTFDVSQAANTGKRPQGANSGTTQQHDIDVNAPCARLGTGGGPYHLG